jgi:outer membrane receptor for ferric coprogen and ferric-rhodotorulic acid
MFDRVEIVRGATGLVTGAGNPSAAINLVRKRPTADQRVTLTGAAGSWDDYRGEIDASSKLNESGTLRGRVVSSYQGADSFRDKEQNDHGLFYAIGEADLSESTTATLGFSRQNEQTNYFWGGLPIGTDGHHLDLPRSTYPGTDWENRKLQIDTVFGEVEHRFDNDWKLHLAGSSSTLNGEFSGTYLSRYAGPLETTAYQSHHTDKQTALDAFASGPFEAFGRTHELVVGASNRAYDATSKEYAPYTTAWPIGAPKPDFVRDSKTRTVTTQDAVYLTTRLSLADPLTLILGGRLDWYDYDDRTGDGDYKVTRNLTRYSGLIYKLDDHHSLYASYTDIFTPQTQQDLSGKLRGGHQGRVLQRRTERQPGGVPDRPDQPCDPRRKSAGLPGHDLLPGLRQSPQPRPRCRTARRTDRELASRRRLHLHPRALHQGRKPGQQ